MLSSFSLSHSLQFCCLPLMSVKTDKTKAVTLHTHPHTHTESSSSIPSSLPVYPALLPLPTVPLCKSKDLPRVQCRRQKTIDSFSFGVTFAGDEGVPVLLYLLLPLCPPAPLLLPSPWQFLFACTSARHLCRVCANLKWP